MPAPRQTGAALALDPDGAVWIAFLDGAHDYPQSERHARVLRRAADDWVEELTISALDSSAVPTALTMQEACCTDLWVGGEGTLQLIVPGGQLLWVGRDGGGTISEEVVLAGQRSAFSPSVAVGAPSLTAVAWLAIGEDIEVGDQWFVFGPRLAVRRDGAWSVETLESLEYRADRAVQVAIDPDGRERLAWIDREGQVIYAERATDCAAR